MITKRDPVVASVFELFCILPLFLLCMVILSVLFVVSLPFIAYKELVDRKRRK